MKYNYEIYLISTDKNYPLKTAMPDSFFVLGKKKKNVLIELGHVAWSVHCRTADPGVSGSFTALSHTFVEIDHVIISTAILLPSTNS